MLREAIVLAGGFGTRLSSVVDDVPKPMAPVNGKPFLHYILKQLVEANVSRVILAVHHKKEKIIEYLGDVYLGLEIVYSIEEKALGTGGGIRQALEKCTTENVLVMNGDSLLDIELSGLIKAHEASQLKLTMALREMEDVSRYGAVDFDEKNRLTAFVEKGARSGNGYINSGIYIFNKQYFLAETKAGNFSLETEFLEPISGEKLIFTKVYNNYFIDIGIPEDFKRAQDEFKQF